MNAPTATITSVWYDEECLFNMMERRAKSALLEFLTEQYGDRCPDFDENCPCCKVWRAFDVIFDGTGV